MKNKTGWTQRKADAMIALVAVIWGSSYLLMKLGLDSIPPYSIIALRFGIAFAAVAVVFLRELKRTTKRTLAYSAALGLTLFAIFAFLTHGLQTTTASNAGFLTSTTVVLVPIFHAVITKKLPDRQIILGSLVTMVGIAFLTLQQYFTPRDGDILCLLGASAYAVLILLTDRFTRTEDGLLLGIWQLGFAGLAGLICTMLFETPALPDTPIGWTAVLGLAFLCSAFGFVVQPVAQKYTTPEHAGLLLALEPVFSAIFAYLILRETLTPAGWFGAVLVLGGVAVTSWIPEPGERHRLRS